MSFDPKAPHFSLVGGGARSGKSRFALRHAEGLGERRLFVATGEALDAEMRLRVARHQAERGTTFMTRELPYEPEAALEAPDADVVLIDCLTLFLSNLLVRGDDPEGIEERVERLERAILGCPVPVVVVTNEVGFGIVPDNALARTFRDLVGRAHQRLAGSADAVYFGALGLMLRLKPTPIEAAH